MNDNRKSLIKSVELLIAAVKRDGTPNVYAEQNLKDAANSLFKVLCPDHLTCEDNCYVTVHTAREKRAMDFTKETIATLEAA